MRVAEVRALYEYDAWANARLLAAAAGLDDGAFVALTRFPRGSLRDTLLHVLNAERFHRGQWADGEPLPDLPAAHCPSVAALAALVAQEAAATRAFLATLTDADLARSRTIRFGGDYPGETAPLWLLMMHTLLAPRARDGPKLRRPPR